MSTQKPWNRLEHCPVKYTSNIAVIDTDTLIVASIPRQITLPYYEEGIYSYSISLNKWKLFVKYQNMLAFTSRSCLSICYNNIQKEICIFDNHQRIIFIDITTLQFKIQYTSINIGYAFYGDHNHIFIKSNDIYHIIGGYCNKSHYTLDTISHGKKTNFLFTNINGYGFSCQRCIEYPKQQETQSIVNGYINKNTKIKIPNELIGLILKYYGYNYLLYLFGGYSLKSYLGQTGICYDTIWKYDSLFQKWNLLKLKLPCTMCDFGCVLYIKNDCKYILFFGGCESVYYYDTSFYDNIYILNLNNMKFIKSNMVCPIAAPFYAVLSSNNKCVYLLDKKDGKNVFKITISDLIPELNAIDCCIVRIVKRRKQFGFEKLINEVLKNFKSFKPTRIQIKKSIAKLIELQYLKRDENNRKLFHYLS